METKEFQKLCADTVKKDVVLQLAALAGGFDVDLEKSVLDKIEILKQRGYL